MFTNADLAENYNWLHPYGLAPLQEILQFEERDSSILLKLDAEQEEC